MAMAAQSVEQRLIIEFLTPGIISLIRIAYSALNITEAGVGSFVFHKLSLVFRMPNIRDSSGFEIYLPHNRKMPVRNALSFNGFY